MSTVRTHGSTPTACRPMTMTVLHTGGVRSDLSQSRYTSSATKGAAWKPREEQVETAMERLPVDDSDSEDNLAMCANTAGCSSASSSRPGSACSSRPGSGASCRRAPPVPQAQRSDSAASGRRTPGTPTKHVALQAVPRKQHTGAESAERINWAEHKQLDERRLKRNSLPSESAFSSTAENVLRYENKACEKLFVHDLERSDTSEESSEEEDSEDDETNKAPTDLLLEFITCIQQKDFENGKKLCKMILLYEPDNPEAVKFQSLIDEKIDLGEGSEESDDSDSEEEGGSTEEEETEEEEGTSATDSEDDSSSSDSSSEEEEETKDAIKTALEIPD